MADYSTSKESFYAGASSSLDPNGGNYTGFQINAGDFGQSLNPQSANQVMEVVGGIKQGLRSMEVGALDVKTFETIPKQQFKEINALARLTGVKPTMHAPVVDPSGWGERGQNEDQRLTTERQFMDVIEKAHDMDVGGNIPVVFHASNGTPGKLYVKEGKEFVLHSDALIDRETGQAQAIKTDYMIDPSDPDSIKKNSKGEWGKGRLFKAEDKERSVNGTQWRNELTKIAQFTKATDEVMGSEAQVFFDRYRDCKTVEKIDSSGRRISSKIIDKNGHDININPEDQDRYDENIKRGDLFLKDAELGFTSAFEKAFKYIDEGTDVGRAQKKELFKLSEKYGSQMNSIQDVDMKKGIVITPLSQVAERRKILDEAFQNLQEITRHAPPKQFESAENFAREKASETFSNVALHGYKKFGKDAPVIAIENWAPGTGFSTPEELGKLVDETRDAFVKKLTSKEGIGKNQAKQIAEKQIGVTWDVGHLNLFKQQGYTDEELAKMTKKIAPKVKHLHLTDNFGFADSHLVPGMGNVPFKQHLEALEKAGKLDQIHKVIEAGGFISQISKKGAYSESLSAFGSPIYGAKNQASWQSNVGGNYFAGYGMSNPSIHHSMYGAGFTALPMELGGSMPGAGGSRLSGNSMA